MSNIIFRNNGPLFVGAAAAAGSNCCCPPQRCCCVPGDEETGPHWEFGKTEAECALAGGTWSDCPPGGCACPPCVPSVTAAGFDLLDPNCVPGVNWRKVLFFGDRNAALHPFGFPFIPGYGLVNKVRITGIAYFNWYCEPNPFFNNLANVLELYVSIDSQYIRDDGLTAGDCPPDLIGFDFSKQWYYRWQGDPPNPPCFGGSSPPLVFTQVDLFGTQGQYDGLQQENADAWQIFEDGPTVSVSCGATEYACEQP